MNDPDLPPLGRMVTREMKPWDRRRDADGHLIETRKAYAAFIGYRDLGTDRSLSKLGLQLHQSVQSMAGWSSQHSWVARARAWDDELQAERERASFREAAEMGAKHVRIAEAVQFKALQALDLLPLVGVSARDLTFMLEMSTKLERLARGEPTERVELVSNLLTPLVQQLCLVFLSVNEIEDKDRRADMFALEADKVVEAIVGRFVPT